MTGPEPELRDEMLARRAELERQLPRFLGMRTAEAETLAAEIFAHVGGGHLRVIDLDADEWHTMDIRNDRITLKTHNDLVVEADVV